MKKVAIITRTKDRPIMLPRVLESVANQTYKNFVWVVVNDAGDKKCVNKIAKQAENKGIDVKVIHRKISVGMEAASNDAIRNSESKYIVIHDDDDSWHKHFLKKTVKYLNNQPGIPGVITWSDAIDETIKGDSIKFERKYGYNHWMKNVYLGDLAIQNRYPPISFLFRRSIFEKVGGFDETLPVLGDWDFNLKVLMEDDIHVIPEALAYYHFRLNLDKANVYGNTVTSGVEKHILYDAAYRNRKLREDIKSGAHGIGSLLALGQMFRRTHAMHDYVVEIRDNVRKISS